jgi:branched-chain amino acid transport system ATP-binding protein
MDKLRVSNVSAGYSRALVIDRISLTVPTGSVVALVGPNGHGKSTLLKAISGLLRIKSGEVQLDGRNVAGLSPDKVASSGISHVPQGDLLFPKMTVFENLKMGAFRVTDRRVFEERLNKVYSLFPKLEARAQQMATSLSGGERRMVGIGRGLMSGATLMMLDEPSLGLAPIIVDQVYSAIETLRAGGISILLVEENPERASSVADHLYLIDSGHITWSGTASEMLSSKHIFNTYLGMAS